MNCFAIFRGPRTVGILLAGASILIAPAVSAETYLTIENVPVDVTAKNAAAARDSAIAVAQSKAFDQLIKQIVANPSDQARLHPGQGQIESFVKDFGVDNERVSTVRYIGLYSVRFKASQINKYLSDSGVTPANEQALQADTSAPATAADASTTQQVIGPVTSYPMAMQLAAITDWVRLHNQLAATPGVARVALDALTHDGAAVTVDFAGDPVALQAALSGSGYVLVQTGPAGAMGQGGFQLQPAGSQPPTPAPMAPPPPQ
jgi:hypothetical protein